MHAWWGDSDDRQVLEDGRQMRQGLFCAIPWPYKRSLLL